MYDYPAGITAGGQSSTFSYGPDRQRWKQVASYAGYAETTLYIGNLLEKVTRGNVTEYKHYMALGRSAMAIYTRRTDQSSPEDTFYITRDHLGSSTLVLDESGDTVVNLSFAAFGERRRSTWQDEPLPAEQEAIRDTTRQGFTGHEHLDNLKLIHMNGRVYDPWLGRFISADRIVDGGGSQGLNRYSYVRNNPLHAVDPSGFNLAGLNGLNAMWDFSAYLSVDARLQGSFVELERGIQRALEEIRTIATPGHPLRYADSAYYDAVGRTTVLAQNATNASYQMNLATRDRVMRAEDARLQAELLDLENWIADSRELRRQREEYEKARRICILFTCDADTALQAIAQGSPPTISPILGIFGKVWASPNTVLGIMFGAVGLPFGATIELGNNAVQFLDYPWGRGALTLGNTILYGGGSSPSDMGRWYDYPRPLNLGRHEMGHTHQYQVLGPLFLPAYFATGGISGSNPFERAANDYAAGGSWWPW